MDLSVNMHQTFRSDRTAGFRIKRRLRGNDGQNQQRIHVVIFPGNEGLLDNFSRIFAIYPDNALR